MTLFWLVVMILSALQACALSPRTRLLSTRRGFALGAKGPRALHQEFTVEKATQTLLDELDVKSWPTWSTQGSAKYVTGKQSPLKVYDSNELSYIISGSMEITNAETGQSSLVQAGDFVTFPNGFKCYWFVKETVLKHWYLY